MNTKGGAYAYLKPGPKARDLLEGRLPPVLHIILVKKTAGAARDDEEQKDPQVSLSKMCFQGAQFFCNSNIGGGSAAELLRRAEECHP